MVSKQEQHQQRRLQILQTALDLFVTKGYYGTSTREISKAAGISSGLMFHYFPSKQQVYEELITIGCQRMDVDFAAALEDPDRFLEAMVDELLNLVARHPFAAKMFVLMENAFFMRDISETVNALLDARNVAELSREVIVQGQLLGQFKEGDPLALSLAFWNALQGIAQHLALRPQHPMPEASWLMDMLRK
ncbi:TetR/AcrR family transcriptional regulator [Paenibacillus athensensis]|uniref:TetR/AcrR family transcriptional regulator n=1 Tax=Paenibacillus athensensis TaxID=1967502 RepID=UPI00142F5FD4|nr:TetR/AcrR family transcriptional regulator [Paenibacillus athensensis]MCD1260796.1 TetR/AcrR family transcriptional regulator [Paenibacillus athensensis]